MIQRMIPCKRKALLLAMITMAAICVFLRNFEMVQSSSIQDDLLQAKPRSEWIFPEDVSDDQLDNRIEQQLAYVPEKSNPSPVLIYQPSDYNRNVQLGFAAFKGKGCKVQNCFLTTLERHKYDADVVLFRETSDFLFNRPRDNRQIWVLSLLESPENTESLAAYDHLINYTSSYRWDSDIVSPYGYWKPFPNSSVSSSIQPVDYSRGKTKQVAWFVSHCLTLNYRMKYANELARFIEVDIFGECTGNRLDSKVAFDKLQKEYRFYLAFENGNCLDYVTEKFFVNALENNVVPIVMGASRSFYEQIAPPNSFVHVDDFQSPWHLAHYLRKLSRNPSKYNRFFQWKTRGRLVDTKFYCRLCAVVQSGRRKVYSELNTWWRRIDDCPLTN